MEPRPLDPWLGIRADLLRGDAAYRRDESDDLNEGGRALRAKAGHLRRRFLELQEASAALKARSELLRQQRERSRELPDNRRGASGR
jgi:hypothetical protein